MNDDKIKGAAKDVAGKVQREVGELTGNRSAQAKGAMRQAEGKVQKQIGEARDAVGHDRDAVDRDRDDVRPHEGGGTGRDGAL